MSKKLSNAICVCTIILCGGACSIGYAIGNSTFPWWLLAFAGGVVCTIISIFGKFSREKDKEKKSKLFIEFIFTSILMVSSLISLGLMMLTTFRYSWVVVMVGGIAATVTYILYNAVKNKHTD